MKKLIISIVGCLILSGTVSLAIAEDDTMLMFVGEDLSTCRITLVNNTHTQAVILYSIFDETGKSISSGWIKPYSREYYLSSTSFCLLKYRIFYISDSPSAEKWKYRRVYCDSETLLQ